MKSSLSGDDARIWDLHNSGFPVSRICGLVGMDELYVRTVICSAWHDDRPAGKPSRKG